MPTRPAVSSGNIVQPADAGRSASRPRWQGVYDNQKKAIEDARREGIENVVLVVEGADKQVSRFSMNREVLAEMLAQVASEQPELRPSDRLVRAMREAEGELPGFKTKDELFDALEASE